MFNKFWKWLSIFAYKQIRINPESIKTGIPGIRDVDNECKSYFPGQKNAYRGFNHCDGDDHYLCQECRFYKPEE
jgi:hypothetical protein